MRNCSVIDCNGKHKAKGYCAKHYERLRTHGDVNVVLKSNPPIKKKEFLTINEMFLSGFIKGDSDECWNWIKSKNQDGYGRMMWERKTYCAHRISYRFYFGDFDQSLCVCHKCDNPSCVNPNHLFLGTHKDNMIDRDKKNRNSGAKGEKNSKAKFNKKIVLEIREAIKNGESNISLSKKYKVGADTISNIKNNKTWSHI